MTDELIEIACMTGRQPLYVKPGPGPVEIRDLNGAMIVRLTLNVERGIYELDAGIGVEVRTITGLM